MTSDAGTPNVRRRDSAQSRQALLMAAKDLFDERGFQRTTTRDIGDRAGLDPTLITRYFGSKAALYLATMRSEFAADTPGDLLSAGRMTELLDRVGTRGAGPIFDAALRRHPDAAVDAEARALLRQRVVGPLEAVAVEREVAEAGLLAEIVSAAFIGVAVGRFSGSFPALSAASSERIAELLGRSFSELLDPPAEPS
ncbi:MAG: TetR family transcriptional regulator [Nakamurella sp.]